jgi:hypothetical protein
MARDSQRSVEGQISLFTSKETPDAFRKAVQILHSKPKEPLSLLQRKLANYAVEMGYLKESVVRAVVSPSVTAVVGA